jgi:energy-coupling factor transporter transmembrane protein EcfT
LYFRTKWALGKKLISSRRGRGWALFGVVLISALAANIALSIVLRGQGTSFYLAVAAALCMGATLAIFFIWIYPVNQVNHNWTVVPHNWTALLQWEASHATNAAITFLALCCVALAPVVKKASA